MYPDISDKPLAAEFDEILPVDLSAQNPWYEMTVRDVTRRDPSDNEWIYGSDFNRLRWGHESSDRVKNFESPEPEKILIMDKILKMNLIPELIDKIDKLDINKEKLQLKSSLRILGNIIF